MTVSVSVPGKKAWAWRPRAGGLGLPERAAIRVFDEPDVPYDFEIAVQLIGGRYEIAGVTVDRRIKRGRAVGPPVNSAGLRKLALDRWVTDALSLEIGDLLAGVTDDGDPVFENPLSEHEKVAFLYRLGHATGIGGVQLVASALELPRSTANKKVLAAREAGELGPAPGLGKAGEVTTRGKR